MTCLMGISLISSTENSELVINCQQKRCRVFTNSWALTPWRYFLRLTVMLLFVPELFCLWSIYSKIMVFKAFGRSF